MLSKYKLKKLVQQWYNDSEVAEFIFEWIKNREVMGRTFENKVERPLKLQDPNDIKYNDIVVSYHATQERFSNEAHIEGFNEESKVISYDITIDIDCKPVEKVDSLELSKIVTDTILSFLKKLDIVPLVKFSGRRGFHIILPGAITEGTPWYEYRYYIHKALLFLINTVILSKLSYISSKTGVDDITKLKESVVVDLQIASPRHMVRVPYSLHEGTGLVSILIAPDKVLEFTPDEAKVTEAIVLKYKYKIDKEELNKLFILSLAVMYK